MRIVKTKKELSKAIEDGERHIKIDSKSLYAACILAETYDSTTALLKHYAITKIKDVMVSVGNEYRSKRYRRSNNNNYFCVGSSNCYYWNLKG